MAAVLVNDWRDVLHAEFEKVYYQRLRKFLVEEYRHHTVYPDMNDIFNAIHYTGFEKTKVVILGQDPYHGPGQAHGLSFSVKPGVAIPASLQNIYKELESDLGIAKANHGHLVKWAEQGVLLLNTVLTVRSGEPNSHRGKGWEVLTNRVIEALNERDMPVVFVLWGSHAQSKKALIQNSRHFLIESPHPSPLSAHRGFFGSRPFSRTNQFLESIGEETIDWELPQM